ncbi:MAG: glutamine amidotransferase [Sedimentisphaerales bacterium]|nr:glutamine amidotransferase [Sedimentisphaerales bacterium]
MIQIGQLVIAVNPWTWMVISIVGIAMAASVWSLLRSRQAGPIMLLALIARTVAIAIVGLILLKPLWISRQPKAGENLIAIVTDNSLSMSIKDPTTGRTRGHAAIETIRSDPISQLSRTFRVRYHLFDTRCRPMTDISELGFDVPASNLQSCIQTLRDQYAGRPLAGVILLTDGIATDIQQDPDCTGLPPIWPVLLCGTEPVCDLAITDIQADQSAFEDVPVTVTTSVHATGLAGHQVEMSLYDPHGSQLEVQVWQIKGNDQSRSFRFRFKPPDTGVCFYRLQARAMEPQIVEATTANNAAFIAIERKSSPYRILYIAGRPNWEYKFLQRALAQDSQVKLTALIRLATKEPKYDFRGRPGQQINPLYRGLDPNQAPALESYDKPVLVRLNINEPNELLEGFPKKARDLFQYHGLILDDIEAAFFSSNQLDLIRSFVSVRGGGLLMLAGKDSLADGQYAGTPIDQVLPVRLLGPADKYPQGPFMLEVTAQGLLQPWLRLPGIEQTERRFAQGMQCFQVLGPVGLPRPGGLVLLTAQAQDGQRHPALVTGRFGNGRSAVLAIGDLWRWGMQDPSARAQMENFWRQMIRSLVVDAQDQVTLTATADRRSARLGLRLHARVLDGQFEPVQHANVSIELEDPNGRKLRLSASSIEDQPGLFEATFLPRASGPYRAKATAIGPDGRTIGQAQTGWACNLEAQEFGQVQPNLTLLQAIASKTGGKLIRANQLDEIQDLLGQASQQTMVVLRPLWDLPGVLPLALAFSLSGLLAAWTIRRTRGLA